MIYALITSDLSRQRRLCYTFKPVLFEAFIKTFPWVASSSSTKTDERSMDPTITREILEQIPAYEQTKILAYVYCQSPSDVNCLVLLTVGGQLLVR